MNNLITIVLSLSITTYVLNATFTVINSGILTILGALPK